MLWTLHARNVGVKLSSSFPPPYILRTTERLPHSNCNVLTKKRKRCVIFRSKQFYDQNDYLSYQRNSTTSPAYSPPFKPTYPRPNSPPPVHPSYRIPHTTRSHHPERQKLLEQLKVYGRSVDNSDPIFTEDVPQPAPNVRTMP